jgi:hypothetical protein
MNENILYIRMIFVIVKFSMVVCSDFISKYVLHDTGK